MDKAKFWQIIDEARAAGGSVVKQIARRLERLPSTEIVSFDAWSSAYRSALHREDLWAAIYLIQGGCSDDGFDYFRAWLVAQGERAVLAAVNDPETLGNIVKGSASLEELLGVANKVHERVYGVELPSYRRLDDRSIPELPEEHVEIPDHAQWPVDRVVGDVRWDKAAYLAAAYPRLWAIHGWTPAPRGEIEPERFWAILEEAKTRCGDRLRERFAAELERVVDGVPEVERLGFRNLFSAYNQALVVRNDLRALARVLIGSDSNETFLGLRGWLMSKGERVVHATMRDLDSIADVVAAEPAFPLHGPTFGFDRDELPAIPDIDAWCADWPESGEPYRAEVLRARFPRVTVGYSDASLTGGYDPARLDYFERDQRVATLTDRVRSSLEAGDLDGAIQLADEGVRLTDVVSYLSDAQATFIVLRARARFRQNDSAGALADYALVVDVAHTAYLERAKILLALGRRDEAIAEAKRQPYFNGDRATSAWLAQHEIKKGPPKRVRHAKFGDGTVALVEGVGDKETLTVDFASGRKKLLRRFVEVLEP